MVEIIGVLGEPAAPSFARGIGIPEREAARAFASHPLVFDQIDIDVDAIGSEDRHAPSKLLASAVPGGKGPLLVFRSQIVVVEDVIANGERSARPLPDRREPDRGYPRPGKRLRLDGQVIPPPVGRGVAIGMGAIGGRRHSSSPRQLIKTLHEHTRTCNRRA